MTSGVYSDFRSERSKSAPGSVILSRTRLSWDSVILSGAKPSWDSVILSGVKDLSAGK